MNDVFLQTLIVAYFGVGMISVAAYWPIIKDLYYKKRLTTNVFSYALWTVSTGITFLYSYFVLADLFVKVVVGLHFLSCASILLLSINVRQPQNIYK